MPAFENQTDLRDVPDVLRKFSEGADPAQLHELMLFARCLFVLGEHGFQGATRGDVEAFMEPARGLEPYEVRRAMLARLRGLVPNPAFDVPTGGTPAPLAGRALRVEIHRRTKDKLARLTQRDALRTERRSMPYYASLRAAFGEPTVDTSHYTPVVEAVTRFLAGRPPARVLDIACAYGLLLKEMGRRTPTARLVGTDILSMKGRICAVGHDQPFAPASFDVVTATSLFEHVMDVDAQVREVARLVKPDGLVASVTTAIHTLLLSRNPLTYLEGLVSTLAPGILPPHHHLYEPLTPLTLPHRAFTRHEIHAAFAKHFERVEVSTIHFLHLRKFGLESMAPSLPLLKDFGGQLVIFAERPRKQR